MDQPRGISPIILMEQLEPPPTKSVDGKTDVVSLATKAVAPGALAIERAIAIAVVLLPLAGIGVALVSLWGRGVTLLDLSLLAIMYAVTGFGITVGFHRLLTHDSFECPRWVRAAFAIAGSMALQGPVARWVADHRRHHAHSDRAGDPHSPRVDASGVRSGMLAGLWHAHWGWFFGAKKTRLRRFVPDLIEDPLIGGIDRLYLVWALLSLGLPPLVAFIATRDVERAGWAFVWGSLVRVFLVDHVTWSINSICHVFGTRPFETGDDSVNCWWLAIPSLGESWHNGHHAFPTSAFHGLRRREVDPSALLIRALSLVGLARNPRRPTPTQLEAKRRRRRAPEMVLLAGKS